MESLSCVCLRFPSFRLSLHTTTHTTHHLVHQFSSVHSHIGEAALALTFSLWFSFDSWLAVSWCFVSETHTIQLSLPSQCLHDNEIPLLDATWERYLWKLNPFHLYLIYKDDQLKRKLRCRFWSPQRLRGYLNLVGWDLTLSFEG